MYVQLLKLLYADYIEMPGGLSENVHVLFYFIIYYYIYVVPFECKCSYSFIHFL